MHFQALLHFKNQINTIISIACKGIRITQDALSSHLDAGDTVFDSV